MRDLWVLGRSGLIGNPTEYEPPLKDERQRTHGDVVRNVIRD